MIPLDFLRIRGAIDLLEQVAPDARLRTLQDLCVNNGIWTVPEDERKSGYTPAYYEIQLFGVPALADDTDTLAVNWMRAARNVLRAAPATAA